MSAINCNEFVHLIAPAVHKQLLFDIPPQDICYSCLPTNQPLFSTDNIYKDFASNPCRRDIQQRGSSPHQSFKFGHVQYAYIYDPYARHGVAFYETRDVTRDLISEDSDLFQALLSVFKARILPIDIKEGDTQPEAEVKPKGIRVRLFKASTIPEPRRSNNEFLLKHIGSYSRTIKFTYLFTQLLDANLSNVFLSPMAALLFIHFHNTIEQTLEQSIKTAQYIFKDVVKGTDQINADILIQAIRELPDHSIHRIITLCEDLDLLNRQSFLFRMQQITLTRAVQEIANLVANQLENAQFYPDVVTALKALIQD